MPLTKYNNKNAKQRGREWIEQRHSTHTNTGAVHESMVKSVYCIEVVYK